MSTKKGSGLMNVADVSEVLGANPATIRRDIRNGFIPIKKVYGKRDEYHIKGYEFADKLEEGGFQEEANRLRAYLAAKEGGDLSG